jgi:hypothetical protein
LKGFHFETPEDVQGNMMMVLKGLPENGNQA